MAAALVPAVCLRCLRFVCVCVCLTIYATEVTATQETGRPQVNEKYNNNKKKVAAESIISSIDPHHYSEREVTFKSMGEKQI